MLTSIVFLSLIFFFNSTPTPALYTLSLHDALPIFTYPKPHEELEIAKSTTADVELKISKVLTGPEIIQLQQIVISGRSEEHTSELQSPMYLVCRLLLEKKKKKNKNR